MYLGKLVEVRVYLVLELGGGSGEAILLCRATPYPIGPLTRQCHVDCHTVRGKGIGLNDGPG